MDLFPAYLDTFFEVSPTGINSHHESMRQGPGFSFLDGSTLTRVRLERSVFTETGRPVSLENCPGGRFRSQPHERQDRLPARGSDGPDQAGAPIRGARGSGHTVGPIPAKPPASLHLAKPVEGVPTQQGPGRETSAGRPFPHGQINANNQPRGNGAGLVGTVSSAPAENSRDAGREAPRFSAPPQFPRPEKHEIFPPASPFPGTDVSGGLGPFDKANSPPFRPHPGFRDSDGAARVLGQPAAPNRAEKKGPAAVIPPRSGDGEGGPREPSIPGHPAADRTCRGNQFSSERRRRVMNARGPNPKAPEVPSAPMWPQLRLGLSGPGEGNRHKDRGRPGPKGRKIGRGRSGPNRKIPPTRRFGRRHSLPLVRAQGQSGPRKGSSRRGTGRFMAGLLGSPRDPRGNP